jgi:DNA-binding transcriptional ArsR family regulator
MSDPTLAKALTHPLRTSILGLLEDRTASPSELAHDLEAPLGVISYHVRRLASLGLLKLVKRVPKRGAVEHYYTAVARPPMTTSRWVSAPSLVRDAALRAELAQIGSCISDAVTSGGFDEAEAHLSRTAVTLDARGLTSVARELERTERRIRKLEAESEARLARADDRDPRQATVITMLFNTAEAGHGEGEAVAAEDG